MIRDAEDIFSDIESLPTGDKEVDHINLDHWTIETLNLCLEEHGIQSLDHDSLANLLFHLIRKWKELGDFFWYS